MVPGLSSSLGCQDYGSELPQQQQRDSTDPQAQRHRSAHLCHSSVAPAEGEQLKAVVGTEAAV